MVKGNQHGIEKHSSANKARELLSPTVLKQLGWELLQSLERAVVAWKRPAISPVAFGRGTQIVPTCSPAPRNLVVGPCIPPFIHPLDSLLWAKPKWKPEGKVARLMQSREISLVERGAGWTGMEYRSGETSGGYPVQYLIYNCSRLNSNS